MNTWIELNDHLFNIEKIAGISLAQSSDSSSAEYEIVIHFPTSTYCGHAGSYKECAVIMKRIYSLIPIIHKIKVAES